MGQSTSVPVSYPPVSQMAVLLTKDLETYESKYTYTSSDCNNNHFQSFGAFLFDEI